MCVPALRWIARSTPAFVSQTRAKSGDQTSKTSKHLSRLSYVRQGAVARLVTALTWHCSRPGAGMFRTRTRAEQTTHTFIISSCTTVGRSKRPSWRYSSSRGSLCSFTRCQSSRRFSCALQFRCVPLHGHASTTCSGRAIAHALPELTRQHFVEVTVFGLQYISERLSLPPDIAGVTLLAFASGAPGG